MNGQFLCPVMCSQVIYFSPVMIFVTSAFGSVVCMYSSCSLTRIMEHRILVLLWI